MLALDKLFRRVGVQLRGFSPTAKMLMGALMVILAMSLVLVALYAGRSELSPLGLGTTLTADARARTVSYLDTQGIPWEESGTDLLVPADRKHAILARLTETSVITAEQIDFESILKEDSPFTPRTTRKARYLVAKMNEVSKMISELEGIARASVMIDQPERPGGIGSAWIEATASVTVLTRSARLSQAQADSIARIVAGAHAPLKVENVTVVDARTARAMKSRGEGDLPATRYLETKVAAEKHAKATIEQALAGYPGVIVAVNAQVDATNEISETKTYHDPKSGLTEADRREINSTNRTSSGEPGVRSNAGAALSLAGGRSTSMTDTREREQLENAFGNTASQQIDPKGYALKINAAVLVPRSLFVRLYRQQEKDDAAEPDDAALQQIMDDGMATIKRIVEPLIDTTAVPNAKPGTVEVTMFSDVPPADALAGEGGGLRAGTLVGESVIKSVGLGALAVVSLFLMFMMVRKASRVEEMPTAEELVGIPPTLAEMDADLVGEVDETTAAMEGVEIDEDSVRRQQMIDQINELAVNSSDEAAGLLRKWIKTPD